MTVEQWIQTKLDSGELTARDIADLTDAFQKQNALLSDAKPGPLTLEHARNLLEYYSNWDDPPPNQNDYIPESVDDDEGELPNLAMPPEHWVAGIDVSHHQALDSEELDPRFFLFAFVKATEGTSGSGSVDPKMLSHLEALREVEVETEALGVYHFARPSSAAIFGPNAGQPLGEAQNFARQWERAVEAMGSLLPPVLDIEDEKTQTPEPAKLIDWCAEWCLQCERLTGRQPIIYTYFSYIHVQLKGCVPTLGKYPLWLADYRGEPPRPPRGITNWPWLFWQYSGSGHTPGVSGACDQNVFRGTHSQLLGLVR